MATKPLPPISVPVIDRFRRWNPIWYKFVKPLLETVKASADDLISVTQTLNAALGQWGIQVNVNNRTTAAVRLDGGASTSEFAVLADRFEVVHPTENGTVKQGFVVGLVDGVPTVGIDGDLVVDDTILARHCDIEELDAISADIGTITAGKMQNANGSMVVDLDNKTLQITTGTNRLRATDGAIAVYTVPSEGSTDNTPFTSPGSDLSRLYFHSSLPMVAIIKTNGSFSRTGTISIGAASVNTATNVPFNLFAHGLGGTPMVFGKVTISGSEVPLCGSVPLQITSPNGGGRWLHLGADATNVIIRVSSIATNTAALAAISIDWEVYVTNFLLENAAPTPTVDSNMIYITEDFFLAAEGQFDSRLRYLRVANSSPLLPLIQGPTVAVVDNDGPGSNDAGHEIRYSVDGYLQRFTPDSFTSSFDASFTRVKF